MPGESFPHMNAECKSYKDFPFHQLYAGEIKILEGWIGQMMDVADPGDFNILLMKFNRKGEFVAVSADSNIVLDSTQSYSSYSSVKHGKWLIVGFDQFWALNKNLVKALCK